MKKIIFILLVILLGYINPSLNLKNSFLEILAPYIEFNKEIQLKITDLVMGISEINKLREENYDLKNKEFIYVSKDYKERVEKTQFNELEKLKKTIEDDDYFKGKILATPKILYLDKLNSKLFLKREGDFKIGDSVLIGRFFIGLIVGVNKTSYEVSLWNRKDNNLGVFVISSQNDNLVANIKSDNYNTSYIENILSTEVVEIGDLVVTSSINEGIPNNLYIGVIDRVEGVSSQTFRKALIKKPYSLEKSNYVILIKND